ncbi:hypothetical protein ABZS66_59160, partial [Dactylosporangium sp. NPDC005572]|uniref:restriction system modified-DNA reader domain-containing protein n=1 Tax=Dactylosporangium sp. NPDC005572 TaxID=3156889 RepID=UPI0033A79717
MKMIGIDEHVYAALRSRRVTGETLNAVLRHLLEIPGTATEDSETPRGQLLLLVRAGLLHTGQQLTWERRNLRQRHTATVDETGWLVLADGRRQATPNMAATVIAGYPCLGWRAWRTD